MTQTTDTMPTISEWLRKKIAIVQNRVWVNLPPSEEKDAVAYVCDGLLDALDEEDRKCRTKQ